MTISPTKKESRSKKPELYIAHFSIKGIGYLEVEARSREEAEEAAWAAYHKGEELQDIEWEADELVISRAWGLKAKQK